MYLKFIINIAHHCSLYKAAAFVYLGDESSSHLCSLLASTWDELQTKPGTATRWRKCALPLQAHQIKLTSPTFTATSNDVSTRQEGEKEDRKGKPGWGRVDLGKNPGFTKRETISLLKSLALLICMFFQTFVPLIKNNKNLLFGCLGLNSLAKEILSVNKIPTGKKNDA